MLCLLNSVFCPLLSCCLHSLLPILVRTRLPEPNFRAEGLVVEMILRFSVFYQYLLFYGYSLLIV